MKAESIDEAWLISVGFEEVQTCEGLPPEYRIRFRESRGLDCDQFCYLVIRSPSKEHRDWGFKACVAAGGCWPGPMNTRRDVVNLCRALGVELKV